MVGAEVVREIGIVPLIETGIIEQLNSLCLELVLLLPCILHEVGDVVKFALHGPHVRLAVAEDWLEGRECLLVLVNVGLPLTHHRVQLVVQLRKALRLHIKLLCHQPLHGLQRLEAFANLLDCVGNLLQIQGQPFEPGGHSLLGVAINTQVALELFLVLFGELGPLHIWRLDLQTTWLINKRSNR